MLCNLPGEFSQEHKGKNDTRNRAGTEGMRMATGSAPCFVPEVSSADMADIENL